MVLIFSERGKGGKGVSPHIASLFPFKAFCRGLGARIRSFPCFPPSAPWAGAPVGYRPGLPWLDLTNWFQIAGDDTGGRGDPQARSLGKNAPGFLVFFTRPGLGAEGSARTLRHFSPLRPFVEASVRASVRSLVFRLRLLGPGCRWNQTGPFGSTWINWFQKKTGSGLKIQD